jgi:DNA repair exonuclease SbcCD ATPase subunit
MSQDPPSKNSPRQPPAADPTSDGPRPEPSPSTPDDDPTREQQARPLSLDLQQSEDAYVNGLQNVNKAAKKWRDDHSKKFDKMGHEIKKNQKHNKNQFDKHDNRLNGHDDTLNSHRNALNGHRDQLRDQAAQIDSHDNRHTEQEHRHNELLGRVGVMEVAHGMHADHIKKLEAKHNEHHAALKLVKDNNKWIGIAVAGLGIAGFAGVAIWGLGKLLRKQKENEEQGEGVKGKGRRHAREWKVMEDDESDEDDF